MWEGGPVEGDAEAEEARNEVGEVDGWVDADGGEGGAGVD